MPSNTPTILLFRCAIVLLFSLHKSCGTDSRDGMVEQSSNMTVRTGKDTTIHFRTGSLVESCVWLWESPERDRTPTVIVGFPGHGFGSADCSVHLVNATQIQTGWWTCRAQTVNSTILHSQPIFLQVFTGPVVTFETEPANRTFSIGSTSELECKLSVAVTSCQWSFQQEGQNEPIFLAERAAKRERDCSLRLEQVSYEQVGSWRCGARTDDSDEFTFSETAYVQVEHKDEAFPIEFEKEPEDTEMSVGDEGQLQCKVREEAHIEDCRWYWQPVGHSRAWRVLMREFLPVNNDCSIQFANVTADPDGFWTCHVKPIHSSKFVASKSAKLTVRGELAVSSLTREMSVSEGEPLTIHCVTEEPAKTCKWKRKALFESEVMEKNEWIVSDPFQSSGVDNRDCSLHISHARFEHQGLWLCTIRFHDDGPFIEAMPSAITIKSSRKVEFEGGVRSQVAAEDQSLRLNCSTLSAVRECVWMWYEGESKVAERVVKFNFTSSHNGYDCGVTIPKAERSMQGVWQCAVQYGDLNHPNISYARPFSLTVVKTGPINFRTVSSWVSHHSNSLECVVREPVEECVWLYRGNHSSEVIEFARFEPNNFNNCSLSVAHEEDKSGWWTCGARNPVETNFTLATPIWVDFAGNEVVSKSVVTSSDKLILVCQLLNIVPGVNCDWIHPSQENVFEYNATEKYIVMEKPDSGICSLTFQPKLVDVGHWKCVFSYNNKSHTLAEASFTVLNSPQNVRLSWIVGVLATVTLMLTVLLFVVITCRVFQCNRSHKGTVQLTSPQPEAAKRYSEDPTKGINFSFTERPELLVDFSIPSQDRDSRDSYSQRSDQLHHYERVGRFLPSRPSFYQNVD